jgi:hypothetical protein
MPGTRRSWYITTVSISGFAVLEVGRLLDAGGAAVARAVGQVLAARVALAGALHEHHRLHFLAVGALDGAAVGLLGECFQSGLVDHVGLAAAELRQAWRGRRS